jgi:hypothetical protein
VPAESMDQRIAEIGDELRVRADTIVEEELARMRREAPAFFTSDDPSYVAAYTGSCVAHLGVLLGQLTSGRDIPEALPAAAVEETRATAQWGIPVEALIQTYRIAHSVIWEHAMDIAEHRIADARVRSHVLKLISRYLFAYTDRMVVVLTQVYEGERMSLFHDRDRGRRQLVRDLLEGLPIDQTKLPYLVSGVHMAAIAAGDQADRALGQIAAQLGLRSLTIPGPSGSIWGWLGGPRLRDRQVQEKVVAMAPASASWGFGDVAEGNEGFRVSHREARQAFRIGRQLGSPVTRYGQVALLSLTTMDESLARQFMHRELGFLADKDARAQELRETLRAYFEAGHNASAAAARLSLNDRTVAYRLRSIEEKLSRPVLSRRDELSVALRLFELYGAETAEPPDSRGPSDFR